MFNSKFVVAASLALATAGVMADSGDQHINDWSTFDNMRSRAEVKAELQEAQRLGLISVGEGDVPIATPEQEAQIAEAGRRAAQQFAQSDEAEG